MIKDVIENAEDEKNALPLAEIPSMLEDLVGELAKNIEEAKKDTMDVGTALKSPDMGSGPVVPGTTSSMSAQGKTGAQEPNDQVELEGRSGFGRTGRANGQGVEDVAKALPQNEKAMEARNTGSPLEAGSVKDEDQKAAAAATGLGKMTDGTVDFGMAGKLPPAVLNKMEETTKKLQTIRESSTALHMKLREHNLPTADLDRALEQLDSLEAGLKNRNGDEIIQAYNNLANLVGQLNERVGQQVGLKQLSGPLKPQNNGAQKNISGRSAPPVGYEAMIRAYFKELADE